MAAVLERPITVARIELPTSCPSVARHAFRKVTPAIPAGSGLPYGWLRERGWSSRRGVINLHARPENMEHSTPRSTHAVVAGGFSCGPKSAARVVLNFAWIWAPRPPRWTNAGLVQDHQHRFPRDGCTRTRPNPSLGRPFRSWDTPRSPRSRSRRRCVRKNDFIRVRRAAQVVRLRWQCGGYCVRRQPADHAADELHAVVDTTGTELHVSGPRVPSASS